MSVTKSQIVNGPATVCLTGVDPADDVGALATGVTITREPEFLIIHPQQCSGPIKVYLTAESYTIAFGFLEPTLQNIDYAIFGGDGTYASGSSFGGDDIPEELGNLQVYGTAPVASGEWTAASRAVLFDNVVAAEPGDWPVDRTAEHVINAKFRALVDEHTGVIGSVTDS